MADRKGESRIDSWVDLRRSTTRPGFKHGTCQSQLSRLAFCESPRRFRSAPIRPPVVAPRRRYGSPRRLVPRYRAARPRRALASHRPGSGMTTKMAYRPGAVVCISATPIATLRL